MIGAVPETTAEVAVAAVEFWALTERAAKKVERTMVENFMITDLDWNERDQYVTGRKQEYSERA